MIEEYPLSSQKIKELFEKEVKKIDWGNKRIFAVHVSYFSKSIGMKNYLQKAAALVEISETSVRT